MPKYQKEKITLKLNFTKIVFFRIGSRSSQPVLFIALLVWVCFGCGSDSVVPTADFFPLRVGQSWVYDVEESNITRAACTDDGVTSTNYELLVTVLDSIPNGDQGFTYTLKRSKRAKATNAWVDFETWTAQVIGNRIVVNESNTPYVKMLTPIANGLVWNGNLYNNRQELNGLNVDDYSSTLVGQPYAIASGLDFDKTVSVVQNDEQSNIIYRDSRLEVYADRVGLVYKETFLLSYFANSQLPCFAQKRTQQGFTYKQSLKEFNR
jgi:hypothetical protein